MKRINTKKTAGILSSYLKGHCKTLPLEDLCEVLELLIKEDGDVIFALLEHHLSYSDIPQPASNKFAWHVDEEGFHILSDYARAKQECLSTFQNLYMKGYIKSTQSKKEKGK